MKMPKYFFLFFFVLVDCSSKHSYQPDNNNWLGGEIYNYSLHYITVDVDSGLITNVNKDICQFKFELVKVFKDSTIINWYYQFMEPQVDSFWSPIHFVSGDSLKFESDLIINYTVDKAGAFIRINNWSDIRNYYNSKWDSLFKESTPNSRLSNEELQRIKNMFTNEKYLNEKLAQPIVLFHKIFDFNLIFQNRPSYYECEYCDSLGLKLETLVDNEKKIDLRFTNKFDNDKIEEYLHSSFLTSDVTLKVNDSIRVNDTVLYSFDKNLELPIQIESWRMIEFNNRVRQISYSIRME